MDNSWYQVEAVTIEGNAHVRLWMHSSGGQLAMSVCAKTLEDAIALANTYVRAAAKAVLSVKNVERTAP